MLEATQVKDAEFDEESEYRPVTPRFRLIISKNPKKAQASRRKNTSKKLESRLLVEISNIYCTIPYLHDRSIFVTTHCTVQYKTPSYL